MTPLRGYLLLFAIYFPLSNLVLTHDFWHYRIFNDTYRRSTLRINSNFEFQSHGQLTTWVDCFNEETLNDFKLELFSQVRELESVSFRFEILACSKLEILKAFLSETARFQLCFRSHTLSIFRTASKLHFKIERFLTSKLYYIFKAYIVT